ncbi:sulfotransferase [Rhodoblastus sp.]|uniref:sulfotransferase family protein n=1 Tax=Rhodoblastus sp. TaxID=1962975 RepID=UPI0026224BFA|nr:sulfotransferase [Rhodoblastus sp.]
MINFSMLRSLFSRREPARGLTPNLFILGAGKSGTTTLSVALMRHPDIHLNAVKEPSFFCSYFQVVKNPIDYFNLFDSPARYRVDASHVYLSNPETPPVIRALFPKARFIVILRDPKNRAYSLFRHMRRFTCEDGLPYEDIPDFVTALEKEDERFLSESFLENCRQYFWNYMYCRSSKYDEQIERYLSLFNRSQFHFLSLAELSRDPLSAIKDIAKFLDIRYAPFRSIKSWKFNADEAADPRPAAAEKILNAALDGVTQRTDRLVGRKLDWSL